MDSISLFEAKQIASIKDGFKQLTYGQVCLILTLLIIAVSYFFPTVLIAILFPISAYLIRKAIIEIRSIRRLDLMSDEFDITLEEIIDDLEGQSF